jgi:uncharacterized membrane protein YtjA (UPF0391 family)
LVDSQYIASPDFVKALNIAQILARGPLAAFSRLQSTEAQGRERNAVMLEWTLTFLIVALIAGFLGFWGLAGMAMWIAKILFFVFLVLFVVSLFLGRRGPPIA